MDAREFTHLTYGELVKQFGRGATVSFGAWDQLPQAERETWIAALAVIHAQIYPHGPPDRERYPAREAR